MSCRKIGNGLIKANLTNGSCSTSLSGVAHAGAGRPHCGDEPRPSGLRVAVAVAEKMNKRRPRASVGGVRANGEGIADDYHDAGPPGLRLAAARHRRRRGGAAELRLRRHRRPARADADGERQNTAQLTSALANALAGDHITLASATYSGNHTLSSSRIGSAARPIVIKSLSKHGATLTGTLTLAGKYSIAYGLRFTGNALGVQLAADDTAALRNWFMGPRGVKATTHKRLRIGYNRFTGGPESGLSNGHHVFFDIPNGSSAKLPEDGRSTTTT